MSDNQAEHNDKFHKANLKNIVLNEHGPVLYISLERAHVMFLLSRVFTPDMAQGCAQDYKTQQHPVN